MNFRYYNTGSLILFILVLSVLAGILMTSFINPLLSRLNNETRTVIDYVGFLSVPAIIGGALWLVNRIGWRWTIFKWLVDVPDMRGRYIGELNSVYHQNYGSQELSMQMVMEIHQTASELVISCFFLNPKSDTKSFSRSVVEQIEIQRDNSIKVSYLYVNRPEQKADPAVGIHEGTVYFIYYPDKKRISGAYYTERPSNGTFEINYQSDKLLHRFNNS